jgi:hypothetical protein
MRTGRPKQTHCQRGHAFSPDNTYVNPIGKRHCRTCHKARVSVWLQNPVNKEKHRLSGLKSYTHAREYHLRSTYRMRLEDYDALFHRQNGACAICGEKSDESLHIDHDHNCCPGRISCGKCIRGLLCKTCNRGIGHFEDKPELLLKAANYLRTTK